MVEVSDARLMDKDDTITAETKAEAFNSFICLLSSHFLEVSLAGHMIKSLKRSVQR